MTTRLDGRDAILASLAAFDTMPDWLAAGMDGDRVATSLSWHVPELASGDVQLVSCTPDRLRAKEQEWLARYTLAVADVPGTARQVVLIGNLWSPGREPPEPAADGDGSRFPEPGWRCWLPDLRLELRVQPSDEALPALPRLVEADAAAQLLQPILREAGYADATIQRCRPVVVRYKPGSRCTVVVDVQYVETARAPAEQVVAGPDDIGQIDVPHPPPPTPVVLKVHQGDKGQAAWDAMTALWQRPSGWRHAVRLAEPLGYLPDDRILVQGPVPEECTLKDLARDAIGSADPALLARLAEELAKTARAIAAVHTSTATYGRTATLEQELAEIAEVVERLALTVPKVGPAAQPLIRRLADLSREAAPDPIVPAHHDFRPAQVLLHQGRVGFIDFDGASMAEPALDLGRFRAKFRDIGIGSYAAGGGALAGDSLAEHLRLLDELCDHFLACYREQAPVSPARVLLWETCDVLTTMLHAWTKVRLQRLEPRLVVLRHQLARLPAG